MCTIRQPPRQRRSDIVLRKVESIALLLNVADFSFAGSVCAFHCLRPQPIDNLLSVTAVLLKQQAP